MAAIDSDFPTGVFRPAPEWRRIAIYLVLAFLVIIAVRVAMDQAGLIPPQGAADKMAMPVVLTLFTIVPSMVIWRSAIRVDGEGIWRRRLLAWDLWPWEAFSEGKIRDKSSIDSFLYPDKPWYWRHLYLEFLTDQHRKTVHEIICKVRNRPEIALPDEVAISFPFRRHARFALAGIQVWRGKQEPGLFIPWGEIGPIVLARVDHDRRDFRQLELRVPAGGGLIRLRFSYGSPSWEGAESEVLAAFLQRHVPPQQFHVNALTGAPLDLAEYHRCIAIIDQNEAKLRKGRRLMMWLATLCVGCPFLVVATANGVNPLNWPWFSWVGILILSILLGLQFLTHWALLIHQGRRQKERRGELEAWYESHGQGR